MKVEEGEIWLGGLTGEESYLDQSPGGHTKTETHELKNAESKSFHWTPALEDWEMTASKGRVVGGEMINSYQAGSGENAVERRSYGCWGIDKCI